jgi:hypothetical protein
MTTESRGLSRSAQRAILLVSILAIATISWLALVAAHDDQGFFGQGAAAWAQAIMSVAAILAAIVIDQGASRRDREERTAVAYSAKAARIGLLRNCAWMLGNVRKGIESRTPAPGLTFEGLGIDAVKAGRSAIQHYIARGSDDDAALVWVLCRSGDILETAVNEIWGKPLESSAQQTALAVLAGRHAQDLRELTDEFEYGLFENAYLRIGQQPVPI